MTFGKVDHLDHPPHGLAGEPSEHIPELRQQRYPLLQLRRIVGPPRSVRLRMRRNSKPRHPKLRSKQSFHQQAFHGQGRLSAIPISTGAGIVFSVGTTGASSIIPARRHASAPDWISKSPCATSPPEKNLPTTTAPSISMNRSSAPAAPLAAAAR